MSRFKPTSHGTREGMRPGVPRLPPGAFCAVRTCPKKPRVETREHDPRKPAASCRGSLGGPPPAWNQPGPPGLAPTQKAPGGNPGTPGVKTIPPSMPDDGTQCPGSNPHRMAPGKACDPVSPGSRRGLVVGSPGPDGRLDASRRRRGQAAGCVGWKTHRPVQLWITNRFNHMRRATPARSRAARPRCTAVASCRAAFRGRRWLPATERARSGCR